MIEKLFDLAEEIKELKNKLSITEDEFEHTALLGTILQKQDEWRRLTVPAKLIPILQGLLNVSL